MMLDEKDTVSEGPFYCYRIGDVFFPTHDEAEEWIEAGNVGGCYSIVAQVWCDAHDWQDEWCNPQTQQHECWECSGKERTRQANYAAQRKVELQALAAWNTGKPL